MKQPNGAQHAAERVRALDGLDPRGGGLNAMVRRATAPLQAVLPPRTFPRPPRRLFAGVGASHG